jgi:flavin-dependent dehydrogenase
MDLGDFPLIGTELTADGIALGYGPRRSVVDTILVEAAGAAGADVRTGVNVDGFTTDDGRITGIRGRRMVTGQAFTEAATLVIGADGRRSRLARAVAAPEYDTVPALTCWYFSYWSGVPHRGVEIYIRPDRVAFAFPTNDGLTAVFVGWAAERLPAIRADIGRHFLAALDGLFDLGSRVRAGRREEPFKGATDVPNFFRKPYGAGWALVGDAGCHKDPVLALGMCDALRDAELLADAVDQGLSGRRPLSHSLQEYERRRNEASAEDYRENLHLASFQPTPAETYRLRSSIRDDTVATRRFFLARQGRLPPEEGRGPVRGAVRRALAASVCAALLLCAPVVAGAQARPPRPKSAGA